jgi:type I restriction-modification system DNA methylase subunit
MSNVDIKLALNPLLKQLEEDRTIDVAEKIIAVLAELLGIKVSERFLLNVPRIDAELSRFMLAPGFGRQAAAYDIPNDHADFIDLKLFWTKKTTKTNLSWLIGITPNYEDAEANDYKNISIDFIFPESADRLIILISDKFKIRSLELKDHVTQTQFEIFSNWKNIQIDQLKDLKVAKKIVHSKLWESFNFEPINRAFYLELVESFSLLVHHLEKVFGRKPSVMFTTRLIGRLLFLWFLKKKNYVNKEYGYFDINSSDDQSEYYNSKLEVLFFEVLNREISERENGDLVTPYLNGGLFDINQTDYYKDPKLTFPDGYFSSLFHTLNKYNFTVDESSPEFQHVAIDPEMLGRIFESLLAEQIEEGSGNNKKKATGAFYTPREIVSYMCEETLIECLKNKIPESSDRDLRINELVRLPETIFRDQDQNKRRDWKPYYQPILDVLSGTATISPLTVLDPAVGSGAFPMGMLQLLVKVYSRLDSKYEKNIAKLKRDILSKSLYGVDIEQTAIEICRLRAWLSIIVDIPEGTDVEPLPNLDFKFACANTLVFLEESNQQSLLSDYGLKDELISIREKYFGTSNKKEKKRLQDSYEKLTHEADLFDSKKVLQLKSYKPFDVSSSSEFYDPELIHGVKDFDIVIGNPPYVDSEWMTKTNPKFRKYCSANYETAKGNWDLFCLFIEKGLLLCKPAGISSMIVPNKLISAKYANFTRKFIASSSTIKNIRDYSKVKVFEVSVYPIVYLIKNSLPKKQDLFLYEQMTEGIDEPTSKNEFLLSESHLDSFEDWSSLFTGSSGDLIDKISQQGLELSAIATVKGAATVSEAYQIQPFLSEVDLSKKNYLKFINTGAIDRYKSLWNVKPTRYLKQTYMGPVIESDSIHNLPEKRVIESQQPKIIIGGMTKVLECFMDKGEYFAGKSTTIIVNSEYPLEYLLGILNSKLITYFYRERFSGLSLQGGFYRLGPPQLQQLPIANPNNDKDIAFKIVEAVKNLLEKISQRAENLISIENQINQYVYKIYRLTPNEIEVIESFNYD